jgi:hypothetical protein
MSEWEINEGMPRYDDLRMYEVWVRGEVRRVRRCGNRGPMTPGTLMFIDCTEPWQNVYCAENDVDGWRLASDQPESDVAESVSSINHRHRAIALQQLLYSYKGVDQTGYGY